MKELKSKLKLTQLSKAELEERQMNVLRGGTDNDSTCNCNCKSNATLTSTRSANSVYGYQYTYGGDGSYVGSVACTCSAYPMSAIRGGTY
jgi:natural product precursor